MPHISIEYSSNLADQIDVARLVGDVHTAADGTGLVPTHSLRTRARRVDDYRIGDGDDRNAFVAVEIALGPGRSDGELDQLVEVVAETVDRHVVPLVPDRLTMVSVEQRTIGRRTNLNHVRAFHDARQLGDLDRAESQGDNR